MNRPEEIHGTTRLIEVGCGKNYITINEQNGSIYEIFNTLGKGGGCADAFCEALARVIAVSIQDGVDPQRFIHTLKGIICHARTKEMGDIKEKPSCPHSMGVALEKYLERMKKEG